MQCHDRCLLLPLSLFDSFINVPCEHVAYQILKYVLVSVGMQQMQLVWERHVDIQL